MPIQLPIGQGKLFEGVCDPVSEKSVIWPRGKFGAEFEVDDQIPDGMADEIADCREDLIKKAVGQDEEALEACLGRGEPPPVDVLNKHLRNGALGLDFAPVPCGTAFKNKGVQPLLDAGVGYPPSPLDLDGAKGKAPRGLRRGTCPRERSGREVLRSRSRWLRTLSLAR